MTGILLLGGWSPPAGAGPLLVADQATQLERPLAVDAGARQLELDAAAPPEQAPLTSAAAAEQPPATSAARRVLDGLDDQRLRQLAEETLERNPELAALRARSRAAARRVPQAGSLPDPMANFTAWLRSPETRVGPQQLMASLSQRFPWFGKLELREQEALLAATMAEAQVEARELALLTELRRLYLELAFLGVNGEVVHADRVTLGRYEELALTRYATGTGLDQAVLKIQAEITRDDARLIEIQNRRATLSAALNRLRDRPAGTALATPELPEPPAPSRLEHQQLRELALANRPLLAAAEADIARAEQRVELARRDYWPDLSLGLSYTLVARRDDPAGIAMPPQDDGKDIWGLQFGFNLPLWRERLDAAVEEAVELKLAALEARRAEVAGIDAELGELLERIRLGWRQLRLFESVLVVQAEQSLRSAEGGYAAGTVGALDLLDAERMLLEVRTATARSRADLAFALARLEGAVGTTLAGLVAETEAQHE